MVRNLSTVTSAPARTAEPTTSESKSNEPGGSSASGKSAPASGYDLPPPAHISAIDVARAVERLNQLAQDKARDLKFRVDDLSGRMVITVINATTNEIVRQIPSEEILNMARSLGTYGTIVDAEI
jgi:flagellar protein FlaG